MEKKKGSLRSTIAVSLTNYLDAGAIVAGASGLTLWQNYLGLSEGNLGWLNAISANCLGAAIGAIIGGFLADRYGRKFIYSYNMLLYMAGVALIMCSVNFVMLLLGFLDQGSEPTTHAMQDISAFADDIEKKDVEALFLFNNTQEYQKFKLKNFNTLPKNIHFGLYDDDLPQKVLEPLNLKSDQPPVFILAKPTREILFVSTGYTIGLGEQLLKTLSRI